MSYISYDSIFFITFLKTAFESNMLKSEILKGIFKKNKQKKDPVLISVKIKRGKNVNKRITLASIEIKTRFMNSISK